MPGPILTRLPHRSGNRRRRFVRPSPWWPTLATRQDEAFRNIWQALRQQGRLEPALQSRPGWSDRAELYVMCVVPIPHAPMFLKKLAPVRDALGAFPFVQLSGDRHLAIPVQDLGFLVDSPSRPDETSWTRIKELSQHAEVPITDFPSFRVILGGFNSFLDVPFLDVIDDGWCNRMHHRLRDFIPSTPDDSFAYLPHLPLGAYTRSVELGSFAARMAPWRDRRFGEFYATSLDVVGVSTTEPTAPPEILHSFELGHERGAAQTISRHSPEYR